MCESSFLYTVETKTTMFHEFHDLVTTVTWLLQPCNMVVTRLLQP
jgi:hypothetical protein